MGINEFLFNPFGKTETPDPEGKKTVTVGGKTFKAKDKGAKAPEAKPDDKKTDDKADDKAE